MKRKEFNILNILSEKEIINRVLKLGSKNLTETGHGFKTFGAIPIIQSAQQSTANYTRRSKLKPAIGLIDVVLAANRNYNKVVEPKLVKIEKEHPNLKHFTELQNLIDRLSKAEFFAFWGHKDDKKYSTLKNILSSISKLKDVHSDIKDDFEIMNKWAQEADLSNYKSDIIGSLPNIAVATFQHLRMTFGFDTIKPDQRVKEVLLYEFGLKTISDINAIKAVEQIAKITSHQVITIDQIFVQYGSSYYNQSANKLSVNEVICNLKRLGVSNEVLSKATNRTLAQIDKLN